MPLKNKKARQAQAQWRADSKFFESNFIVGIENNNIDDPDYIEGSDSSDSKDGWAISLFDTQDDLIPDLTAVSDSEDEFTSGFGINVGDKRKAEAVEWVDTSDDEDAEGAEEVEAHKAAAFADDFWNRVFLKVSLL
jgi:hypothetical protein